MKTYKVFFIILLTFIIHQKESWAQPDFNVTQLDNPAPGYLIFDWVSAKSFFAVDNYGYSVLNQTPSNGFKTSYFKQLSNGLWAVVSGNKFYLYDENLDLVDSLRPPSQYKLDFHDIIVLKNGNYLLLCTEEIVTDLSKEVEGGFADAILIYNVIVETNSIGTIFWEWNSSDHMKVSDASEGVNLRNKVIDLVHINSLFETEDGNILVSIRHY
ncbi:MAG: aryl-sulfate sulfotransferase, partial [Candidatus Kapabacteria bacterium]|nr:aryl-sulfate sulfotransferase [Candidatus Kapabacteria bacterium]